MLHRDLKNQERSEPGLCTILSGYSAILSLFHFISVIFVSILNFICQWILDKMQKETKIKILFFVIMVGSVCMLTAVVTDHWAVLSPQVENVNTTCEAAHFGLWRLCKKHIYIEDEELIGKGCGPISLPGGK